MGFIVPPKLNVAVYAQEDRQGEEQLDSLQFQLQMLKEESKRWGSIAGVYVDTCSSSRNDRPGLLQLVTDMLQLKFDVLIVTELWRLCGNIDLGYELSERLHSTGRHLITLDHLVNTLEGNPFMLEHYKWLHFEKLMKRSG